jgi:hypothetical protein
MDSGLAVSGQVPGLVGQLVWFCGSCSQLFSAVGEASASGLLYA